MENSDRSTIIDTLRKLGTGEAGAVTHFEFVRRTASGAEQEVQVEVLESILTDDRFSITARTKTGRETTTNPEPTVEAALRAVKWHELDE